MFAPLSRVAAPALALLLLACSKGQVEPPTDAPDGPKVCTEIGCLDGLQIALKKETPWPAGAYTFDFTVDGAPVRCSGALPLGPCDAGPSLTCDVAERVVIGESGCALPAAEQGFSDVRVPGAPAEVAVTITHEGAPLHQSTLKPTYVESRPNGPGCDPVCRSATAELALP